jgi:hypothetical protein
MEQWLRRRLRHDATVCLLLGPVAVSVGQVVLILTFWFAYALTWIVAGWAVRWPSWLDLSAGAPITRKASGARPASPACWYSLISAVPTPG